MNVSFPKISEVEINGLNPDERKKIEDIIYDSNFKSIFYLDKQYLKKDFVKTILTMKKLS